MRFVPTIPHRPLLIASLSSGCFQGQLIACAVSGDLCQATCSVTLLLLPLLSGGPGYFGFCTLGMCKLSSGSSPTVFHAGLLLLELLLFAGGFKAVNALAGSF